MSNLYMRIKKDTPLYKETLQILKDNEHYINMYKTYLKEKEIDFDDIEITDRYKYIIGSEDRFFKDMKGIRKEGTNTYRVSKSSPIEKEWLIYKEENLVDDYKSIHIPVTSKENKRVITYVTYDSGEIYINNVYECWGNIDLFETEIEEVSPIRFLSSWRNGEINEVFNK